ncbi:cysteine desulfurase NifS [Gottschalkiaceae bacterium SANA]|nr:cysteine desulfurase NifS [Gottschalkiaceae bacterium SANA]
MRQVYMDYSATTPVKEEVLQEMLPYFTEKFGNASSIYSTGRQAKHDMDAARKRIADRLHCAPEELYFTSGGSEADNWAIKGIAKARKSKGNHIITSKIEHHAVLHVCETLEKEGFDVTYLDVDDKGLVDPKAVEAAITDQTILITIMYINNEIGTIEPIVEIGEIAKKHSIVFHTDALQALGNLRIDLSKLPVDLMSFSAHKIYGPKGVGALYVRKGIRVPNLIEGGAQERRRRAGTENVAGIIGFAKAVEVAYDHFDQHVERLVSMREKLINGLVEAIPDTRVSGDRVQRHPGNVHVCFKYIEGESILLSLDMMGIAGSSGSACTSGSLDPSHVLMAIGLGHDIAHGSLRLTIGDFTTEDDIDYILEQLPPIIDRLRRMSPLYEEAKGAK